MHWNYLGYFLFIAAPMALFYWGYSFGHAVGYTDGRADMYKETKNVRA